MSLEHLVGTATVISSLAGRFVGYPAQIRLIIKTRMVSNLSVTLHSIGFVSCLLWTWHGWLNGDWVILLTQGLAGIAATGSMLFLIWRYCPRRMAGEHLTFNCGQFSTRANTHQDNSESLDCSHETTGRNTIRSFQS